MVKRCPLTFITPLSYEYIKAFSLYNKGYLPNGNAWNKESNKFIQAMMVVENQYKQIEQQESSKQGTKWQNQS